jgi:hypothetical protein
MYVAFCAGLTNLKDLSLQVSDVGVQGRCVEEDTCVLWCEEEDTCVQVSDVGVQGRYKCDIK